MSSAATSKRDADEVFDVVVIGAGFGGLGAGLALAELGARVCVCEALRYPGGCASTFSKAGARFDAGATLLSGLGKEQLFGRWLSRYAPDAVIEWTNAIVELRTRHGSLVAQRDRQAFVDALCALPSARPGVREFFDEQRRVADALWTLFDEPSLLPPLSTKTWLEHIARMPAYAPIVRHVGRTLHDALARYGIASFAPLRLFIDALCQITVQCDAAHAEAPFALAAMDYYHRGTAHVHGGVGTVAEALLSGVRASGGDARMSTRAHGLRRDADGMWTVHTRRGDVRARTVVANLLPSAVAKLLDASHAQARDALVRRAAPLEDAWGASMLYAIVRDDAVSDLRAQHLQLIDDDAVPLSDGNHVFVSLSHADEPNRAPRGHRAMTASTHVPLPALRSSHHDTAQYIERVHAAMRATIARRAPQLADGIVFEMTASPRTFERFVGRPLGAVGGAPRYAGLRNYASVGPTRVSDGLWLVGDSVFPGQSALAAAAGGTRAAEAIRRELSLRAVAA